MKFIRTMMGIGGFILLADGIKLTGFDSDMGLAFAIAGIILLVGAFLWGRAAKKKAQQQKA